MRRASWFVLALLIGACLEPGDLSNSGEIYDALNARDSGTPGGAGGSSGGSSGGGSGGSGGSSSGGMGGSGGSMMDASMPVECGDVLEDLIKPRCGQSVCHSTAAAGPLDVQAPDIGSRLIGTEASTTCEGNQYINAANPEQSLIYAKLSDDPPCGARMPFGDVELSEGDKACVLEYIEQLIEEQ